MENLVAVLPVIDREMPGYSKQLNDKSVIPVIGVEVLEIAEQPKPDSAILIEDVKAMSRDIRAQDRTKGGVYETISNQRVLELQAVQASVNILSKNWKRQSLREKYTEPRDDGRSLSDITSEDEFLALSAGKAPLLTRSGEKHLGTLLKESLTSGDFAGAIFARDTLINSNLRLVLFFAKKYPTGPGSLKFADYVQAGNIGLERAVDKFNPETENTFSTYARNWINSFIMRHIKRQSGSISIPDNVADSVASINKLCSQEGLCLFEDSLKKISDAIDVPVEEVKRVHRALSISRTVSLYKQFGNYDDTTSLNNLIPDLTSDFEQAVVDRDEVIHILRRLKDEGLDDYAECLRTKYLSEGKVLSNSAVAEILGVTPPTVRRRIEKASKFISATNEAY